MRFYVETFGCQMNVADSLEMGRRLRARGYRSTRELGRADIVLVNSCTVRDHAEHKALSYLGRLADWKEAVPGRLLIFAGCAAERLKDKLGHRFPQVGLVVGAKSIADFDQLLEDHLPAPSFDGKQEWTDAWGWAPGLGALGLPGEGTTAFVTTMRGCNYVCTYCVVPSVRGRELYRPAASVLAEVAERSAQGQPEILLLGQTVNSYRPTGENADSTGRDIRNFSDLLEAVDRVPGVRRIRFMSPHPHYVDEDFARRMGTTQRVCPHIHLPVQSGSDPVLARMRRTYTRDEFVQKVETLRRHVPGIAVTTDFIVGFPGETEEDFQATLRLVREADFDGAYTFKYSPRPGTGSAKETDDVSEWVKDERLARLMDETDSRSRKKLAALAGQNQNILVEAVQSLEDGFELDGRTEHCRKMFVTSDHHPGVGAVVRARVDRVEGKTLYGRVLEERRGLP
ncbi:MAG: tRNA (N6-isopentenyl adenosine(37)-C2)-methylthiotransferase MiaB [Elusimicrobia bacterium]|jgi:tRNA-2-methylthio-N6-dimethylallyladenosine synthase|nr:tRNA (N6-isopentenyl adenosine(37)-C2)-methylthiotransferase MiaB [Elusimicrobiota bacterium]